MIGNFYFLILDALVFFDWSRVWSDNIFSVIKSLTTIFLKIVADEIWF